MDTTKMWDYRVVRRESEGETEEWYSIQEVYYDEDGTPMAQTLDLMVEQDTITGMRTQLESMLRALDNTVLDESDITDTKNDWICEICGKSTKDVEYDYIGSGTNHLGCELDLESETKDKYLYESPDGGETIYRRKFGDKIRENMKNLKTGRKTSTEMGL